MVCETKFKFKKTEIGLIPYDWKVKTIGDICEITSSKRIFRADYVKKGVPFFRSKEIIEKAQNKTISTELFISEEKFRKIKEKYGAPKIGDILLSAVGARSGIPYYVTDKNDFYFKDGNLVWFKNFRQEKILSKYLFYYLKSNFGQHYINTQMIGSAQGALTIEGLKQVLIKFPSLQEQYEITKILSIIDEKIRLNCQLNKNLQAIGQAVFQRWFVDFEFPDKEGKPYKSSDGKMVESQIGIIPEKWEVVKLGDISDVSWGDTNTTKASYVDEGFDAYSASGLDGKLEHYDYEGEGIIVSAIGAHCGQTWYANGKWSCIKNTLRIRPKSKVSMSYLFFLLNKAIVWPKRGSAQPFISQTDARNVRIVIPGKKILANFTKIAQQILAKIDSNKRQNYLLSQLRDTLLPKLMSGQIRIPVENENLE